MDKAEVRRNFGKELTLMAEVLGAELKPHVLEAYWEDLRDIPIDKLVQAIRSLRKTAKFFPKPAEIREAVEGSAEERASLAWSKVLRVAKGVGPYRAVTFGDPVIHATINALGGWQEIWWLHGGNRDAVQINATRAEFLRLYRAFDRRRELVKDAPTALGWPGEPIAEPISADKVLSGWYGRSLPEPKPMPSPEEVVAVQEGLRDLIAKLTAQLAPTDKPNLRVIPGRRSDGEKVERINSSA